MSIKAPHTYPISQSPLYMLSTKKRLCNLLRRDEVQIRRLTRGACLYKEWDEPKRSGGSRHIENPCRDLKLAQARVSALLTRVSPPDFLTCPVRGRSYVSNAAVHTDQEVVRTLDITSYFASTLSRRVFWFFRSQLKCAEDVAGILTSLATVNGHLATGSPLSPILSYWTHVDMWERIAEIVYNAGCRLTIYMDDLTVSGPIVSDELMWQIKREVHRCGLRYNKEKRYGSTFAEVTGVIIRGNKLVLPSRRHLKMHELRHLLSLTSDVAERKKIMNRLRGCDGQAQQLSRYNASM